MPEYDRLTHPHVDESESKGNCTGAKKKHGPVESNESNPTKILENPVNPPSGNK